MKRLSMVLLVLVLTSSLVACYQEEKKVTTTSDKVMLLIKAENIEAVEPYLGILYESSSRHMDDLFQEIGTIQSVKRDRVIVQDSQYSVRYALTGEDNYFVTLTWEKQPNDWLVSEIDWVQGDKIVNYMPETLIEKSQEVYQWLALNDYQKLYNMMAKDFGEPAGLNISSVEALEAYLTQEFSFIRPRFYNYEIDYWSVLEGSKDDEVLITVNKDRAGTFRLGLAFDDDFMLTGIYCIEFEHAKAGILQLLSLDSENIEKPSIDSAVQLPAYVIDYLKNNQYDEIYRLLDASIQKRINEKAYRDYLVLMKKRAYASDIDTYIGTFVEAYEDIQLSLMSYSNGYVSDVFTPTIEEKENAIIRHGFNAYMEMKPSVYVTDNPEDLGEDLYGIALQAASLYEVNESYYETLNEQEQNSYYVPILSGRMNDYTPEENAMIRLEKAYELIEYLKYEEFDLLWQIESYQTGFENQNEYITYYQLQSQLIGTFNSIYVPLKDYNYLMTGQFVLEFLMVNDQNIPSRLIVAFDANHEILSYDVIPMDISGGDL